MRRDPDDEAATGLLLIVTTLVLLFLTAAIWASAFDLAAKFALQAVVLLLIGVAVANLLRGAR